MKFVLEMLKKTKPLFENGGKLSFLYPVYEATEAFLFTPDKVTSGKPHVREAVDSKRFMITVAIALMPCALFGIWNAGHQQNLATAGVDASFLSDIVKGLIAVLPLIIVSYAVGGMWEVLFACVKKHEINEGFLVTGLLFPLTLPPTVPLWQVAVGISFGVVIGKEIFGGVGYNILNPALAARAYLFFAHPAQMSGDSVWTRIAANAAPVDGFTGATPLAVMNNLGEGGGAVAALKEAGFDWLDMFLGMIPGSVAETSVLCVLLGLAILLASGVGSWRITLSGLLGLFCAATLLNIFSDGAGYTAVPFYYHIVMGGFMFGITFMATDPVSAAASNTGKYIYGFMIGFLVVIVRVFNPAFPELTMLVILFMNVMAPMIDHYVVQAHIKRRSRHAQG